MHAFSKSDVDNLLQLKKGKILFYYFREDNDIYIYNEKIARIIQNKSI